MRPADFWSLHPTEFHWLMDAKRPPKMYGSLTEHDVSELLDLAYGEDA